MERLRVLLVNPPMLLPSHAKPYARPPLGIAYLAGVLEKSFDVKVIDCVVEGMNKETRITEQISMWGVDTDELSLRVTRWEPDVVSVTCSHPVQEEIVFKILRTYKEHSKIRKKNLITVVGGGHASAVPWQMMENEDVDFVVVGEGEIPLFELCRALQTGKDISGIDGLAYRDYMDKVMVNERKRYVDNLDQIPFPARHLLLMEKYYQEPNFFPRKNTNCVNVRVSRGCDYNCIFCEVPRIYGNKFRLRSVENVLEELFMLVKRQNVQEIYFEDSNILKDRDFAKRLFKGMIDNELKVAWSLPAGITLWGYDIDLMKYMKLSGCYQITLNIESGDEGILGDIIKSPNDLDMMINFFDIARAVNIPLKTRFRVGYPGAKKENLMHTFEFINKMKLEDAEVDIVQPIPGTPLWEICTSKNLFARTVKYRDYMTEKVFINTDQWTAEELSQYYDEGIKSLWRKKAMSRPGMIMDKVKDLANKFIHPFTSKGR